VFGVPIAVAAVGSILAVARNDSRILRWSALASACLVALLFSSLLFANVSFSGYG
jgi:hypothetical protein